jgi:hypothetical protein
MMTYYEELGVPAEASREQIRQAYKRLVRLLHPDQCGDPATRVLAELQMRRLNGILEVLSHPGERANYDRSLVERDPRRRHPATAGEGSPDWPRSRWYNWWDLPGWQSPTVARDAPCPEPPDWEAEKEYARKPAWQAGYLLGRLPHHTGGAGGFAWWRDALWRWRAMLRPAAAVAGVLGLVLFCALMRSSPPVRKPVAPAAANPRKIPVPRAERTARAPSSPAAAAEGEDAPMETLARYSPPAQDPPAEALRPANPEHTAMRTPAAGAGEPAPGEDPSVLSGDWFFVPAAETGKDGYPPEYIELRLSENEGVMRGRYRARYRVTDRAISPNVTFQFEGHIAADGGVLPWRGPGGAQGEITLRLLANGNLEVAWEAGHLGEELELISGTATLVRKRE